MDAAISQTAAVAGAESMDLLPELARHHEAAFHWALTCAAHDRAEAEDVLQMSYLRVLEGSARFQGRSSFRTFLFGVIRRVAASRRRTAWIRKALPFLDDKPASLPSADDVVTRGELLRVVRSLPRRQREVLELVFFFDCTIEEAGNILAISIGTARTHYDRGKRALEGRIAHENR